MRALREILGTWVAAATAALVLAPPPALGGSALRYFTVLVNYPEGYAEFDID